MCSECFGKRCNEYCYSRHNCFICSKRYKSEDYPQKYKDKNFCSLCNQHYNEITNWGHVYNDRKKGNRKCSHLKFCRVQKVTMFRCGHHACCDCRIKWKNDKNLSLGCHVVGCTNTLERDNCEPDYNFDLENYNNESYVECLVCAPGHKPPERPSQIVCNNYDRSPTPSYSLWED